METEQINGGNMRFSKPMKAEFCDDVVWQELCEKTRYVLPNWDVEATPENIRIWLNRLEINEAGYREAMQTSIQDMIVLNPGWPLRSLVGILLEYKYEQHKVSARNTM